MERTHADFELSRWARLISITCSAVDNHAGLQAEYARTGLLAEDMLDIAVVAGTVAVEEQDERRFTRPYYTRRMTCTMVSS